MAELLRTEVRDGVATLTLDSPANRNALSAQLMAELIAALHEAGRDPGVRVVVLTASGPVFCSGADLRESAGAAGAGAAFGGDLQNSAGGTNATSETGPREPEGSAPGMPVTGLPSVLLALLNCPRPVVARIAGTVRAGGVGLVAACDLAVSLRSATYAFSEVRLGLVPAVVSAVALPLLPRRAAAQLLLTGEVFDGARAAELGLVTSAVADDELDPEVDRLVGLLRRGAPNALAVTKSLLRPGHPVDLAAELVERAALSARHFAGPEGVEGMAAFRDKRPPAWLA